MPTPEGLVLSKCKEMLKKLEIQGKISHWTRINVGTFYTQWGSYIKIGREFEPDLWVFVPVDDIIWIMFLDTKKSSGGDNNQDVFFNKFNSFHNVICSYITDSKQMKILIENIRRKSKTYGKLESWELPEEI